MNSMKKIYMIKEICDQSKFIDHYGESAAPAEDIIMAYTDPRIMFGALKELRKDNVMDDTIYEYETINLNEEVSTENTWIPLSFGIYPEEKVPVNVTYLGYYNNKPTCGESAYYNKGNWYWTLDDSEVNVKVLAWKELDEPYDPNKV